LESLQNKKIIISKISNLEIMFYKMFKIILNNNKMIYININKENQIILILIINNKDLNQKELNKIKIKEINMKNKTSTIKTNKNNINQFLKLHNLIRINVKTMFFLNKVKMF